VSGHHTITVTNLADMVYLGPVLILLGTVLVLLIYDMIQRSWTPRRGIGRTAAYTISLVGTGLSAGHAIYLWNKLTLLGGGELKQLFVAEGPPRSLSAAMSSPIWTAGALSIDYFSLFVILTVCGILALVCFNLLPFLRRTNLHRSELFPLLLLSACGMMLLGMSRDLLVTFISIEIVSLPLYVLCGLNDEDRVNQESSLKYFLLGAFASGFFIFGAAWIYGAAGHLNYAAIAHYASHAEPVSPVLLIGLALIGAGLGFKLALVPFHAWVPDVYQGAPTPVTGFMAAGVKLAVFAAVLRLALEAFPQLDHSLWSGGIALLAALSMVVGNLLALHQMSAKRLLAYSAIAHTGYIAVGLAAGTPGSASSLLVYLVGYGLAGLGAFALITYLAPAGQDDLYLDEMHELSQRAPVTALAFAILLLSMGGFPLTLGFIGKLLVFTEAWRAGLHGLVIFAVLNSVVSVYYYLRFVLAMYMQPRAPGAAELELTRMPATYVISGAVTVGLTLLLGVMPQLLLAWTQLCQLSGL